MGEASEPAAVMRVREHAARCRLAPARRLAEPPRSGPLVLCVVRDEAPRLPDFLAHHRALGVPRFVFIDNGSDDGTDALILRQGDCDLWRCAERFDGSAKQGWITALIEIYGRERWYLVLDADEHLAFPGEERGLDALLAALEAAGEHRPRALMVDRYAQGPVLSAMRALGESLASAYPLFDAAGYRFGRNHQIVSATGGPRHRAFSPLDPRFAPQLTKHPLFRPGPGEIMESPHFHFPYRANFGPCRLALLHYKFDGLALERVADAVRRGVYWNDGFEYRLYRKAFALDPALSVEGAPTRRYRGAEDLVAAGLVEPLLTRADGLGAAFDRARRARRARCLGNEASGETRRETA